MFKRILIANRGEIAVRLIRACKDLGIETVAIYSTADRESLHVKLADYAVCVGKAPSKDSYLNMSNILSAATLYGCQAVHPGFGFLSENDTFARLVEECNMTFIGPSAQVIERMGNKSAAKALMREANVPIIEGSAGALESYEEAKALATQVGYPILLKASHGGGGRGMRIAYDETELAAAWEIARQEAKAAFGNDEMYLEKFIESPRHIEFQILGDRFGNVIHLYERECSMQRRNQKLIEESPSPALNDALREEMAAAAVRAAKAVGYVSAGTIEFVLDRENRFYFIEMNTRIQVEHGVTELVTGVDLVKEQLRIAAGFPLKYKQEDIRLTGHCIECRINAENPLKDFQPSPGKINFLHLPGGPRVRVDSAIYNNYTIPSFYDSMIAKVMAVGESRLDAIRKMRACLEEMIVDGVYTNLQLQYFILHHTDFVKGNYNTGFLQKNLKDLVI